MKIFMMDLAPPKVGDFQLNKDMDGIQKPQMLHVLLLRFKEYILVLFVS